MRAQVDNLRQDLEAARAQLTAYELAGENLTPSQLEIKTAVRAITALARKFEALRVRGMSSAIDLYDGAQRAWSQRWFVSSTQREPGPASIRGSPTSTPDPSGETKGEGGRETSLFGHPQGCWEVVCGIGRALCRRRTTRCATS